MTEQQLQAHIYNTYITLRVGLFFVAAAFPILLWLVGRWNGIDLQSSMSDYYFAFAPTNSKLRIFPGRVVFVGLLFALGVALILYRGFTKLENWLLNLAGVAALVAALFPMQAPHYCDNCENVPISFYWHWVHPVAGVFVFGCLFAVAVRCTKETQKFLTDPQKTFFQWTYWIIAGLMILTIALAGGIALAVYFKITDRMIFFFNEKWIFYFEAIGLLMFAAYWLVRSIELSISQAEWSKLTGKPQEKQLVSDWALSLLDWIGSALLPASTVKKILPARRK